jgi:hypothetical protein
MSKLMDKAVKIRQERLEKERIESEFLDRKLEKDLKRIISEFEIAFSDIIPLLLEEGITYTAHYNTKWTHQGSHILFKKGDREIKMDFLHRDSYRYEYTFCEGRETIGRSMYDRHSMEDFIIFIDEGLFKPLPKI